jgi:hypothetical protein
MCRERYRAIDKTLKTEVLLMATTVPTMGCSDEPLLRPTSQQFVLFPIQYDDASMRFPSLDWN